MGAAGMPPKYLSLGQVRNSSNNSLRGPQKIWLFFECGFEPREGQHLASEAREEEFCIMSVILKGPPTYVSLDQCFVLFFKIYQKLVPYCKEVFMVHNEMRKLWKV